MHGKVIKSTGSTYTVRTDDGRAIDCKVKGNFRLRGIRSTNPVAVGDGVSLTLAPDAATAYITELDERRNYIVRKASNLSRQSHILAANVDLALLLVTVARPETTTTFIDRFLASAEAYRVPVALVFNKVDDLSPDEAARLDYLEAVYTHVGYDCHRISALHARYVDECASAGEFVELAVGGGVHACPVGLADVCGTCAGAGHEEVEEGGLAYARVARKEEIGRAHV